MKKETTKKRIGIAFSGGIDSTALVIRNLKAGYDVTLLRYDIGNNWSKNILERKACDDIVQQLKKDFPGRDINYSCRNNIELNSCGLALPQPVIWTSMLAMSEFNSWDKPEEIQIGYILNDDAISYLVDIKKLYNKFTPFRNSPAPKLVFPLTKEPKQDLWKELKSVNDNYEQYNKMTVTCENPNVDSSLFRDKYYAALHNHEWEFLKDLKITECGNCHTCDKKVKHFGKEYLYNTCDDVKKELTLQNAEDYPVSGLESGIEEFVESEEFLHSEQKEEKTEKIYSNLLD